MFSLPASGTMSTPASSVSFSVPSMFIRRSESVQAEGVPEGPSLLVLFLSIEALRIRVGECTHLITQMVYSQGKVREWLHLAAALVFGQGGFPETIPNSAIWRLTQCTSHRTLPLCWGSR